MNEGCPGDGMVVKSQSKAAVAQTKRAGVASQPAATTAAADHHHTA